MSLPTRPLTGVETMLWKRSLYLQSYLYRSLFCTNILRFYRVSAWLVLGTLMFTWDSIPSREQRKPWSRKFNFCNNNPLWIMPAWVGSAGNLKYVIVFSASCRVPKWHFQVGNSFGIFFRHDFNIWYVPGTCLFTPTASKGAAVEIPGQHNVCS